MWKASEVRDYQIIVPMLYLALWQVKLLLGFDETKQTVIHQKHSKPCMSMLGTKTSPISITVSFSFRAYLKYARRHPVQLERYRENQRGPIYARMTGTNLKLLCLLFLINDLFSSILSIVKVVFGQVQDRKKHLSRG